MLCARCNEDFSGRPVTQGGEYFCSLECANLASGIASEEIEEYFEEEPVEDFFTEDE